MNGDVSSELGRRDQSGSYERANKITKAGGISLDPSLQVVLSTKPLRPTLLTLNILEARSIGVGGRVSFHLREGDLAWPWRCPTN